MNSEQHKKNGFTLIELLISTTLIVLLMLGISSLFMTFLIGSAKTNTKTTIKEEGVYALSQMEFLLKNARYVGTDSDPCDTNMDEITVTSFDGGETVFERDDERIASNSSYLTSKAVDISSGPRFDCTGTVGNRQVKISFTLRKVTPDGTESEEFESIVNVRN